MESYPDQECRGRSIMIKTLFNTLDQNIIKYNYNLCLRFELIVLEKRIN